MKALAAPSDNGFWVWLAARCGGGDPFSRDPWAEGAERITSSGSGMEKGDLFWRMTSVGMARGYSETWMAVPKEARVMGVAAAFVSASFHNGLRLAMGLGGLAQGIGFSESAHSYCATMLLEAAGVGSHALGPNPDLPDIQELVAEWERESMGRSLSEALGADGLAGSV